MQMARTLSNYPTHPRPPITHTSTQNPIHIQITPKPKYPNCSPTNSAIKKKETNTKYTYYNSPEKALLDHKFEIISPPQNSKFLFQPNRICTSYVPSLPNNGTNLRIFANEEGGCVCVCKSFSRKRENKREKREKRSAI